MVYKNNPRLQTQNEGTVFTCMYRKPSITQDMKILLSRTFGLTSKIVLILAYDQFGYA